MELTKLLRMCTEWKESPEDFALILRESIDSLKALRLADLAHQFEVAESTVSRWAAGIVKPHPLVQRSVVRKLGNRIRAAVQAAQPDRAAQGSGLTPSPGRTYAIAAKGKG